MSEFVTTTGLSELQRDVNAMEAKQKSRLKSLAFVVANRLAAGVRTLARSYGWQTTPNEVTVRDVPGDQLYVMEVKPRNPRPMNLPLWLEHGTVKMAPRPFVGPPTRTEQQAYPGEVEHELQALLDETVNR